MAAPVRATRVSFVESFLQPTTSDECVNASVDGETPLNQRPSLVVVAGDSKSLNAVKTVHSPKSVPTSPSFFAASISPRNEQSKRKSRSTWMHKLFSGGWVGPAEVGGSLFVLLFSMNYYRSFLQWNVMRSDVKTATLSDPVLQLLTPMDCSIVMSAVLYGMLVAGCVYCRNKPDVFITAAQTLTLALWTRMLLIYLVPLKSPRGAIPLSSSIHETVGSAPSLVACTLLAVTRRHHRAWRWAFASFAMVSGLLALAQKLQYTADLLITPSLVTLVASAVAAMRQTVGQITSKAKLKKL